MRPDEQSYYTTPQRDMCLYTEKNLCYEEDDRHIKKWQLFEEGTNEEYWLPESSIRKVPKCSVCNTPLKIVITTEGKFWGCRNYTSGCRAYIPIEQYDMTEEQEDFFNHVSEIEGFPNDAEEARQMANGWYCSF